MTPARIYFFITFLLGMSITISTALTSICALSLMTLFLLSGDYQEKCALLKRFYIWPAIALLLMAILSISYTPATLQKGLLEALKLYKLLLIWVMAYLCQKFPTSVPKFLWAFFIGVLLNVLAIYLNYYVLSPKHALVFSGATFPAAQSHFLTGFIFAITAFMFLSMAIAQRRRSMRILYVTLALIILCAELGLNTSRTGYLIEFSILSMGFLLKYRWKGCLSAILILPMVFTAFYTLSPTFHARIHQAYDSTLSYYRGTNTSTSAGLRLSFYRTAWRLFSQKPQHLLYGCGSAGQWHCSQALIEQQIPNHQQPFYRPIHNPHNQYIHFLMQSGIITLGLFLWLLMASFYYAKDLPPMMKNNLRILLMAFSVGCLLNSWILDIGPGFIFCYLLPVLLSYRYWNQKPPSNSDNLFNTDS